jgi:hypothetical protein
LHFYGELENFLSVLAPRIRHKLRLLRATSGNGSACMTDILLLALGAGLFVIAAAYVYACDRL